jgi:anaerobic magnesium-protoporphyrin IX monomethyl ester cyclase
MRILLIDPPGWQKHSINLGLSFLAGTLFSKNLNVEVKVLDLNNNYLSEADLKNFVGDYQPQVVGISIKTATANSSKRIFSSLHRFFPDIIYVAGGPHMTLCAEEFLSENRNIDFGILGEGELPFSELIEATQCKKDGLAGIRGLSYYRKDSLIINPVCWDSDVSQLAFPRFEAIVGLDFSNFRYPLLTSRGCPHGCIFCCVGAISGKKWRAREPENVIKELRDARQRYQINSFEVMDDNFTFDLDRAKRICRLLIKEKLNLDWWCHNGLRADKLDDEILGLMKRSGCKSIALGIESGDESVFDNLAKGETLLDIRRSVKMIQKAGINCVGYFIVGLPGDSIVSTKKTVKFQRGLKLSDHKYNLLVPYPGTKIWEIVNNRGRMLLDIKETSHFGDNIKASFEMDGLNKKTIEQCYYLATQQSWIYGEEDLRMIGKTFNSRYGKGIKRILIIGEDEVSEISECMRIEYGHADILGVRMDNRLESKETQDFSLPPSDRDYFGALLRCPMGNRQIIINILSKRLFLGDRNGEKEGYIRGEALPIAEEWEKCEGRYYTTRLNHFSPSTQSAKNGVVYRNGIALPFSPTPQWERVACGKIESGIAFISLAAHNTSSTYTTDYLTMRIVSDLKELIPDKLNFSGKKDISGSLLELVLCQTDCLVIPESLKSFAFIFSKAKMNVVYSKKDNERFAIEYKVFEPLSIQENRHYFFKNLKNHLRKETSDFLTKFYLPNFSVPKVFNVLLLWPQILALFLLSGLKKTLSRFNISI